MDARIQNIRSNIPGQTDNRNVAVGNIYKSNKRKYEDAELSPQLKRRMPCRVQPYTPENASIYSSRRSIEQQRQQVSEDVIHQPKRYSANDRFRRIRHSSRPPREQVNEGVNPQLTRYVDNNRLNHPGIGERKGANVPSVSRSLPPREQVNKNVNQQPRRYSANSRLKNIRRSFEEGAKMSSASRSLSRDKLEADNVSTISAPSNLLVNQENSSVEKYSSDKPQAYIDINSTTPIQTTPPSSLSHNQRNRCLGIPRPSSLQDRKNKIKGLSSYGKGSSQNDQWRPIKYNTGCAAGWYKSVDLESKDNRKRQDGAFSCVAATNLNMQSAFQTNNQAVNRDRMITSVLDQASSLGNNDFVGDQIFEQLSSKEFSSNNSFQNDNTNASDSIPYDNISNNNRSTPFSSSSPACTDLPTITHSSNNNANVNDDTTMEWSYFEENEILSNLQELRKHGNMASANPQTPFQETIARESQEIPKNTTIRMINYIVVDTNIFLSHLDVVKKAMKIKLNGLFQPIILVPWIVIQELDYIKDGRSENKLKSRAQAAIRFIHDSLCSNANLKCQSVRDAAQQDFASSCFDDGILHCCLQIRERRNRAILLTNDINLRNKLMTENFETYSHHQIFKRLDPYNLMFPRESVAKEVIEEESEIIKKIKTLLSHTVTLIIMKELKNSYGELWNRQGFASKTLPWSLKECLDILEKYWVPVFQMKISKLGLRDVQNFNKFLQNHNGKVTDAEELLTFGLTLCVHLKQAYTCYFETVTECIANIQKTYDGT